MSGRSFEAAAAPLGAEKGKGQAGASPGGFTAVDPSHSPGRLWPRLVGSRGRAVHQCSWGELVHTPTLRNL